MAPTNAEGHEPIKLSDSDEFRLEDQAQDTSAAWTSTTEKAPR